jgi:hypothetical protein
MNTVPPLHKFSKSVILICEGNVNLEPSKLTLPIQFQYFVDHVLMFV